MIQIVVAVRDAKADCFGRPFFVPTVGLGVRSFQDEVNRAAEDNPFYRHPEDFALYELGTYDDEIAQLSSHDVPKLLIQADQVKK